MLIITLILLCVVVSQSHGLELVRAEYGSGQFNKRVPSRNDSVIAEATSSLDTLASSLTVADLETYQIPIDAVSNTTIAASASDLSIVITSSEESSTLSTPDSYFGPNNLGTITTIARPTLVLPTSTPIRGSSRLLTQPTDSTSSSTSNTNADTSLPPVVSSFTFNTTSRSWGWNTTSSASSLSSPTVILPPSTTSTSLTVTSAPSECPAKESGPVTVTSYSITHTSTTTWTGDPSDYIPPYPPISTPKPCTPKESPTGRFTITFCDSTGKTCTLIQPSTTNDFVNPTQATTVTLITTDKNPAVVFPTQTPPSYGGSPSGPNGHESAVSGGSVVTPDYGIVTTPTDSAKSSPTPTGNNDDDNDKVSNDGSNNNNNNNNSDNNDNGDNGGIGENGDNGENGEGNSGSNIGGNSDGNNSAGSAPVTIIVQPGQVIVDDHTFTDDPAQQTSTVVIGSDTFTIDPSRVIGAGATVTRPPSNVGGGFVPTPILTTTSVGGIGVVYGPSSIATIDGTIFTIKPTPTVAVIKGQSITLGPQGIIFPGQTLHVAAGPGPTQTAVMGGELITAIGPDKVVIEGTTITYGPDSGSTITTVVDGDTVLIAPTGVIVHNETLGGVTAAPGETNYEIAGGATITQLGLTAVEVSGITFHVGRGALSALTTVVGGHTLTIGPSGVGMETWTIGAPYASTTTLMPGQRSSNNVAMTVPTATGSTREDSGSSTLRPDHRVGGFIMVLGVGCLGPLLIWR
ncbi:hypothetical protein F4804DRAFT_269348 [Jackrogersella minutella]|nr:hypothetical protein F4804DRAFT_269348 [Jackrogersella minutella]